MTHNATFKSVLKGLPRGIYIPLPEIQDHVSNNIQLDVDDLKPASSYSSYPAWKKTLQGCLNDLKKNNLVEHQKQVSKKCSKDGKHHYPSYKFL